MAKKKQAAKRTVTAKKAVKRATVKKKAVKLPHSPVMDAGLPKYLGMKLTGLTKKKVTGEMPISEMHLNRTGRVAGGAIMSFADVLGAVGSVVHRPPGYRGGTVESKTNFFAAGRGPVLYGVSVPLHIGRTTSVWQTTIKNEDGGLVAVVTQTQIALPKENPREGERT